MRLSEVEGDGRLVEDREMMSRVPRARAERIEVRAATDTGANREAELTARADASFANIATCANHATCAGCATYAGFAKCAGNAISAESPMCAEFA